MRPRPLFFAAIAACLFLAFAAGCKKNSPPPEKDYPMRGEVIKVEPATKTATIKNEKIGDWMDAMTMDFPVKDAAEFAKLHPGDKITATVHTHPNDFTYWIDNIQPQR